MMAELLTNGMLDYFFICSVQLIVARNGCCGLCIEHSVAEGIVYINMAESVIRFANERCWAVPRKENQVQICL